jgi:hypothetical protein
MPRTFSSAGRGAGAGGTNGDAGWNGDGAPEVGAPDAAGGPNGGRGACCSAGGGEAEAAAGTAKGGRATGTPFGTGAPFGTGPPPCRGGCCSPLRGSCSDSGGGKPPWLPVQARAPLDMSKPRREPSATIWVSLVSASSPEVPAASWAAAAACAEAECDTAGGPEIG